MTLTCLCGSVRLTAPRPGFVHACNCTLCSKTGARWGYFHPDEVDIEGPTTGFARTDKAAPNAEVHFCATCGATTHFVLTPAAIAAHGNTMLGVNMALAEPGDLAGVELRFPDGRGWDGASAFGYVREAEVIA